MTDPKTTTAGQALNAMQDAAIKVAVSRNPSAKLAHRDAVCCYAKGDFENARLRALVSLSHSVGVFHRVYIANS
tara:strand:- start:1377 stop:1598 length:222 start_codon:yes stop_codon:yes gene_type:complete